MSGYGWAVIDADGYVVATGVAHNGDERYIGLEPGQRMVKRPPQVNAAAPWRLVGDEWTLIGSGE